jgi:hypothetical protein
MRWKSSPNTFSADGKAGLAALVVAACFLPGCGGDDAGRHDISGTAAFDGKPIVYGHLEFIPDRAQENEGPAGYATITDGKFNTADGGRGVVEGPHQVRVTAYESRPAADAATADEIAQSEADQPQPLFSGYTLSADLSEATHEFNVPADAAGFDLFKSTEQAARDAP